MDLRIITYNIHKGVGWLNRKPTISKIADQLGQLNPEVIFIQEIRHHQFELLASKVWEHYHYAVNVVTKNGSYGNAILSTFPIKFCNNLNLSINKFEKRSMLHVIISDHPSGQPIHLLCAHLGLFDNERKKQVASVIKYIKQHIPKNEAIILAGDFNDWNSKAIESLINELGVIEAYMHKHKHYARTFPAWAPVLKLDRIFVKGFSIISAQRVVKNPWRYLSDHIALEAHLKLK